MREDLQKLIDAASRLPEADRIRLTERLLESFDGDSDPGAAQAWAEEIERRTRDIEAGRVQPIPWSEVKDAMTRPPSGS